MHAVRSIPLLAVLCAALLAGCGGSKDEQTQTTPPPTPEQQVTAAAQRVIDQRDPAVVCRTLVTQGFVQEVFAGDVQKCVSSSIADAPKSGKQVVGDVQVSGPKARVEILQQGGEYDGLGGHYTFVRDGRAWKLDTFEDDLVRTTLLLSAEAAGEAGGTGAFTYAPLRECATKQFQSLSSEDARAFFIAALNKTANAKKMGNKVIENCPDELAGYVANELADALAEGHSKAYVTCMRKQLTGLLLATGLAKEALKGNTNDAGKAALQGLALGADKNCKSKDTGQSA